MGNKGIQNIYILSQEYIQSKEEEIIISKLKETIKSGCKFSNSLYKEFDLSSKTIKELESELEIIKSKREDLGYDIKDFNEQNEDEESPYEGEYDNLCSKEHNLEREVGFRNKTIFINSKYKDKDVMFFGGNESNMYYNINIVYVDDLEKVYITNRNNMIAAYRNEIFDFYASYDFLFVEQIVEVEWEDFICRGKIK